MMGELTREDIQRALAEYPATFVPLPPDALDALDVMPVRPGPRQFAVDIPLWSVEEGRSDLSLSVNVDDSLRGVRVAIANLHVL